MLLKRVSLRVVRSADTGRTGSPSGQICIYVIRAHPGGGSAAVVGPGPRREVLANVCTRLLTDCLYYTPHIVDSNAVAVPKGPLLRNLITFKWTKMVSLNVDTNPTRRLIKFIPPQNVNVAVLLRDCDYNSPGRP